MATWFWQWLAVAVLLATAACYGRGWLRLRRFAPVIATERRLVLFVISLLLLLIGHWPAVIQLSEQLLWVRAVQKILLCFLAPPLFWLACPFHILAWGMPLSARHRLTQWFVRKTPTQQRLQTLTNPGIVWLLFVCAFLIWHDTNFVDWSMVNAWSRHVALWVLGMIALLFWWHVVQTGPRFQRRMPGWVFLAYLIGADIPNMVCGVTISFSQTPLYAHYAAIHATAAYPLRLSVLEDQMVSGGLLWVSGSLCYFTSAIMVIRKLFLDNNGHSPQPFPNWDSDERMIAPGLEHRVHQKG